MNAPQLTGMAIGAVTTAVVIAFLSLAGSCRPAVHYVRSTDGSCLMITGGNALWTSNARVVSGRLCH